MNILIRADASVSIGTGHVVRCLTLADELKQRGASVSFACRKETGNLIQYIEEGGYKVYPLPADIDFETDCELTRSILKTRNDFWHWLIVDHYGIDISWETPLREFVEKIMVIDDLANRCHDCDLLLIQIFFKNFETRYDGRVPDHCRKLLGPRYALLRPEFKRSRKNLRHRDGVVFRILISFGGNDQNNETAKALRAIRLLKKPKIAVDVVVGFTNPHKKKIKKLYSEIPNITFYCQVDNIAELMANADLAIGAGGTSTWERCCIGLPSIVIVLAENQKDISETLGEMGIVKNIGWYENVSETDIKNAVKELIEDPVIRHRMTHACKELVDGKGTERTVGAIFKNNGKRMKSGQLVRQSQSGKSKFNITINLTLKEVKNDDIHDLFKWRNHPSVRRNFFNAKLLSWEEHEKWFKERTQNPNTTIYIAHYRKNKIGTIRFESKEESIKVSVMLNPEYIGKGFGSIVIRKGTERFIKEKGMSKPLIAEIKNNNIASIKAFSKAGFKESHLAFIFNKK